MTIVLIIALLVLVIFLGVDTRAETGYGGSSITITTGGTYTGGGTAGYTGGSAFTFCPTTRSWEKIREWVKTTCDQYEQGISGALSTAIDFEGFSTRDANPPLAVINVEYALVVIVAGSRTYTVVLFLERYKVTASTSGGCHVFVKGRSDGSFTIA